MARLFVPSAPSDSDTFRLLVRTQGELMEMRRLLSHHGLAVSSKQIREIEHIARSIAARATDAGLVQIAAIADAIEMGCGECHGLPVLERIAVGARLVQFMSMLEEQIKDCLLEAASFQA